MGSWTDSMSNVSARDKMKMLDNELRVVSNKEHCDLIEADIANLFGSGAVKLFGLSNEDLLRRYETFNASDAKWELGEWGQNRMNIMRELILARMS